MLLPSRPQPPSPLRPPASRPPSHVAQSKLDIRLALAPGNGGGGGTKGLTVGRYLFPLANSSRPENMLMCTQLLCMRKRARGKSFVPPSHFYATLLLRTTAFEAATRGANDRRKYRFLALFEAAPIAFQALTRFPIMSLAALCTGFGASAATAV